MGPQPICLVEGGGSANEEEEASAPQALGLGGHCQQPKMDFSTWQVPSRYQLGSEQEGAGQELGEWGLGSLPLLLAQEPPGWAGRQRLLPASPTEHLESILLRNKPPTPSRCPRGLSSL